MNESPARLRIVADDRERAGGVIAVLGERSDVDLVVERLPVGDFLVEEFAVERKTLIDFAASVVDTRLFKQAAALAQGARCGVLILEGTAHERCIGGVSRQALQGALITVAVFYGLAVLRAQDATETAQLLVYLGRQARRFVHHTQPRPGYRPKGRRARQLFLLQGLPGVGRGRAAQLLDHFGSAENVFKAPASALASVDGIGGHTAGKIRWALEELPGASARTRSI